MKKLMFVLVVMMAAFAANAQSDSTQLKKADGTEQSVGYTDKDVVSASELPATVQDKLKAPEFAGWNLTNAYKKERDGKTWYAVELRNANETKIVKFDDQGNQVKEKMKK